MNKLNQNPTHVAHLGYNPFPMHQSIDRTDTVGQITPVYYDLLQPGDKINAKVSIRTRTMPLLAPASAKLNQCVDWFFVPLNQILSQFGNWKDNVRDEKTDFYYNLNSTNSPQNLPCFNPWTEFVDVALTHIYGYLNNNSMTGDLWHTFADMFRLADCLHIPIGEYFNVWNSANDSGHYSDLQYTNNLNIFVPAAYQKIYFDYFRLSDREANDVQAYNFDSFMSSSSSPTSINSVGTGRVNKLFTLRYAPHRKDFYRNLFISPIQGQKDLSSYGVDLSKVNQWLSGQQFAFRDSLTTSNYVASSNPTTVFAAYTGSASMKPGSNSLMGQINPVDMKSMFAIQKMLEISRRAGKHFDAQTLAHYGIEVPTGISGEVMHLGHHEQGFVIGDVISTSDTYDDGNGIGSVLGEMAGKGYSSGMSSDVNFTAPYDGVLMAVYYVVPDVVYSQHGLDRIQTYIAPQDWPRPELDSIGEQPHFGYQNDVNDQMTASANLDWEWRFKEKKQKANLAYGGVHEYGSLHYWALSSHEPTDNLLDSFLVSPSYLNDIMVKDFISGVAFGSITPTSDNSSNYLKVYYSTIYNGDPFVNHFEFYVNKSSKMSTYGLLPL